MLKVHFINLKGATRDFYLFIYFWFIFKLLCKNINIFRWLILKL